MQYIENRIKRLEILKGRCIFENHIDSCKKCIEEGNTMLNGFNSITWHSNNIERDRGIQQRFAEYQIYIKHVIINVQNYLNRYRRNLHKQL